MVVLCITSPAGAQEGTRLIRLPGSIIWVNVPGEFEAENIDAELKKGLPRHTRGFAYIDQTETMVIVAISIPDSAAEPIMGSDPSSKKILSYSAKILQEYMRKDGIRQFGKVGTESIDGIQVISLRYRWPVEGTRLHANAHMIVVPEQGAYSAVLFVCSSARSDCRSRGRSIMQGIDIRFRR